MPDRKTLTMVVEEALCCGGEEQYADHQSHATDAARVVEAIVAWGPQLAQDGINEMVSIRDAVATRYHYAASHCHSPEDCPGVWECSYAEHLSKDGFEAVAQFVRWHAHNAAENGHVGCPPTGPSSAPCGYGLVVPDAALYHPDANRPQST